MALTPRIDRLDGNIIINGAMDFWQRSTGATQSSSSIEYNSIDRFGVNKQTGAANTGNINLTQQTDVPTQVQAGFRFPYSVRIRCNQAYAAADPQFITFEHRVEGSVFSQVRDKMAVFSFWAKSNKLGTYHVTLNNQALNQYYVIPFTVSQSLVWTKYTFVVDFASAPGTWVLDNTLGLRIAWWMFATAEKKGSVSTETWFTPSGSVVLPNSQVNFMDSTSNDLFIAGVMMRPFEEPYLQPENVGFVRAGRTFVNELQLCQRYFEKSYDLGANLGTPATLNGAHSWHGVGTSNRPFTTFYYKIRKRTTPSVTLYNPNTGVAGIGTPIYDSQGSGSYGIASNVYAETSAWITPSGIPPTNSSLFVHWAADAEL